MSGSSEFFDVELHVEGSGAGGKESSYLVFGTESIVLRRSCVYLWWDSIPAMHYPCDGQVWEFDYLCSVHVGAIHAVRNRRSAAHRIGLLCIHAGNDHWRHAVSHSSSFTLYECGSMSAYMCIVQTKMPQMIFMYKHRLVSIAICIDFICRCVRGHTWKVSCLHFMRNGT